MSRLVCAHLLGDRNTISTRQRLYFNDQRGKRRIGDVLIETMSLCGGFSTTRRLTEISRLSALVR
jgi:hypothetical protein